jgi:hypothetical protein
MFEIVKEQAIRDMINDGGTAYTDTESRLTKVVDNEGDLCHCWCDAPIILCTCPNDPDAHCPTHGMTRPGMNIRKGR